MDNPITRAEHNEFARRMEDEHARQNKRISELETKIEESNKIYSSIERLATSMENMQKEQAEQGERLTKLETKDGDMWRTVVKYLVTATVGIIIGFVFKQIGMEGGVNMSDKTKLWIKSASVRAIKTVAQTAIATIGTSAAMGDVNWVMVGSSSLLSGILSILTSVAGLPEVNTYADGKSK